MHAVDDLGDAITVTRNFLTPVRIGLWLKLALIVLFIGGSGFGAPGVSFGDAGMFADEPTGVDTDLEQELEQEFGVDIDELLVVLAVIGVILLGFWLLWAFVAALMEFVFIDSLRTAEVRLRRYGRENLWRAVHLFSFRVVVGIGFFLAVGIPVALIVLGAQTIEEALPVLVLVALGAMLLYLLYAVVMRFTSEFVAPIMIHEQRGILSGWSRFMGVFKSNPGEYLAYLVLIWIVQLAIGIGVGFLAVAVLIIIAIPVGILAILLTFLGDVGLFLAVLVVGIGTLLFLVALFFIQVPIESYYKYYALLVLGDTSPDLDLIPDQRAAVRTDGGDDTQDEKPDTGVERVETADEDSFWDTEDDTDDWERDESWNIDVDDEDDKNDEDDSNRGW